METAWTTWSPTWNSVPSVPNKEKKETSDSINEADNLLQEIRRLQKEVIEIPELRERIHQLHEAAKRLLDKNAEESLEQREKINELNLQVEALKSQVEALKLQVEGLKSGNCELKEDIKFITNVLEISQATWLWEKHLARFVLPKKVTLGYFGRYRQMKDYIASLRNRNRYQNAFVKIQSQCGGKWTKNHWEVVNTLRNDRNPIAHPKKVDLVKAEEQIGYALPDKKKECKYMIMMLKKVDSLMKFGKLASEFQQDLERIPNVVGQLPIVLTTEVMEWGVGYVEALSEMASFEQDIDDLQDVEPDEAERHVLGYVRKKIKKKCKEIIQIIKKLNSWKFGKLARECEENIVQYVLDDARVKTIVEMNKWFEENTEKRNEITKAATERWNKLTKSTEWSKEHDKALHVLKSLDQDCTDALTNTALKIDTAKLHVVDFLDENLRKQGFEILDIFEELNKAPMSD